MSNAEVILYIYNDIKQMAKRIYWRFAIRFYPPRIQKYFNYISKEAKYNRGEGH